MKYLISFSHEIPWPTTHQEHGPAVPVPRLDRIVIDIEEFPQNEAQLKVLEKGIAQACGIPVNDTRPLPKVLAISLLQETRAPSSAGLTDEQEPRRELHLEKRRG